jgi:prefoldin subunit 5
MKDQTEQRLQELRSEFKIGEAQLEQLDRRRAQLRDTLLRISGAIQVLEELLNLEQQHSQELENTEQPEMHPVAIL